MARIPVANPTTGTSPNREMSIPTLVSNINAADIQTYTDMAVIDGRVTTANTAATALTGRVGATETSVTALNSLTATHTTQIGGLTTRVTALEAGGGGGGTGNVTAVTMATAGAPTTPFLNTSAIRYGVEVNPRDVNVGPVPTVDIRYFGATMVAHGQTATDAVAQANLIALQAALDWGYSSGGAPVIPAGILDIFGTGIMRPGSNLLGISRHATRLRQRQIARASGETYADVLIPEATLRCATATIANLIIDGGWKMRQYEGASGVNWTFDPATMTQKGLHISTKGSTETNIGIGGAGGTNASAVFTAGTDAHLVIQNVHVTGVAGDGIVLWGRGELQLNNIQITECGRNGMRTAIADSFYGTITVHKTGNSGIVMRGGASNSRWTNIKSWYSGLQLSAEPASALGTAGGGGNGIEICDPGTRDIQVKNLSTQDNWGAGLSLNAREGIVIDAVLDEAGGGRLQAQGQGFAGTRTLPRAFVRCPSTLVGADVKVKILGGRRLTAADYPYMIDLQGSGLQRNKFEFGGEKSGLSSDNTTVFTMDVAAGSITGRLKANGVLWTNGLANAKYFNEVYFEEKLDYGALTTANIEDPTHGVNDPLYGPSVVTHEFGTSAKRKAALVGGGWEIDPITMTQAAYNALTPAIRARGNFRVLE